MSHQITKNNIITSLLWKLMETGGTKGIQFIIQIILARLLLPEEFGLIVLVAIFITIAGVIVQSGFNTALIQKNEIDAVELSSVFYLNLIVSFALYTILFFTAPYISVFFDEPQLSSVLRILSFTLFFGAFNSIQNAVIARNMQFKKLFFSSLGAILVSGTVGISMAYAGFGVWALVGQQLTNQLMITVILWFIVQWRPKLLFSLMKVKKLFSFGWKLLVASLIDTLYLNIQSVFIGKMYSSSILAFYNRGEQFPSIVVSNINGSVQSVMFPTLAAHQDDRIRVKEIMRRAIVTSSFIIFPMMVGLAVIAEPLVRVLLTEKWLPAVPFLQIFCASFALYPIHTANLQAINALGRSDIFLRLEIIKKVVGLTILLISIPFGVYAMALGVVVTGVISTFINAYPNLKLLNYSFKEQWKDIIPSLLLSFVMGSLIYSIQLVIMSDALSIVVQIIVGITLYIGLANFFKLESFTYLIATGRELLKQRK